MTVDTTPYTLTDSAEKMADGATRNGPVIMEERTSPKVISWLGIALRNSEDYVYYAPSKFVLKDDVW